MIILSIGSDRNLFIESSEAQRRIKEYGKLFEQLHIIVFSGYKENYKNINLGGNIFIYPTNHVFKLFYLYQVYKIAKSIYKSNKFSAITAQDPFEFGLAGWLLKLRYRTPLQIQIHTDAFSPYFWQESFKNKTRVLLAKFLLPRADGIRVVSERIKKSLLTPYSKPCILNPISVLPIFIDVKKIQSAQIKSDLHKKYPNFDFIILIASRLTKEKNVGMAIEAMRELLATKYPDFIEGSRQSRSENNTNIRNPLLLIVGDGPERENIQLSITNYQLQNNVIIEPWTDDLISYYKTADLFLLTSNYEGYGRTVIEAMAVGLPAIMTNVGLAGEILKDNLNGLVIPINNLDELKRGIKILMNNKEKRRSIGRESIKIIDNFPTKKDYLEKYRNSLDIKRMLK